MKAINHYSVTAIISLLVSGFLQPVMSKVFTPGPGDVLKIALHYPETMQFIETVSPDYTISFVYIGKVSVKNRTIEEIQKNIASRLSDGYLRYPVVTVSVEQVRSKKIYVFGEVASPGAYPWTPDLTVLSAVALAGGFTRYSPSEIQIYRPTADQSHYARFKVSLSSFLEEKTGRDILVAPDDVLMISDKSFK